MKFTVGQDILDTVLKPRRYEGTLQPVLKHGSRSARLERVSEAKNLEGEMKVMLLNACGDTSVLRGPVPINKRGNRVGALALRPERWRTILDQGEARRKPGGGPKQY